MILGAACDLLSVTPVGAVGAMTKAASIVKRGKTLAAIAGLILLSACTQWHEATERARTEDAARDSAIQRINVSTGNEIPEHPSFNRLGVVGGHCPIDRNSEENVFADFLRRNAYLKFGDSANGVIDARAWYISHTKPSSSVCDLSGTGSGEFYCCGVTVQFTN